MSFFIKVFLFLGLFFLNGCSDVPKETTDTTITQPTPEPTPSYFPIVVNYPSTDVLIMAGSKFTYSVSGGKPPYSFSLISGGGTVNETSGLFEAGSIVGNSVIEITDSVNQKINVKVRVAPSLSITPQNAKINITENILFNVTGGVPPYSFFIESGSGFINGLGFFTSNATPSNSTIRVYDSQGNNVSAQVLTNRPVKISPENLTINRGESLQFSAIDGFPPYTYQISGTGNGTINSLTGEYIAPSITTGTIQVSVTDSAGYKSTTSVTINPQALALNTENVTVSVNKSFTFKASGGLAPYTFRKISGAGTILASGVYYAPENPGSDVIQVEDSEHHTIFGNITITNQLSINPNVKNTVPNRIEIFTANGGVPPYSFQIISGSGSISNVNNNSDGEFIAPSSTGTTVIQLIDSQNSVASATININPEVQISPMNPTISVGNSITFIGSGGIPPYSFSLSSGPGIITAGGVYTADSGVFTENRTAVVSIRDSKNTEKISTITITPNLSFSESNIIVKSGSEKIISAFGGVPPFTLSFKNGSSSVGSSILNIPDGNGGFTMKYIAGFVNDDHTERLKIVDAYNNSVEQNVSIFGGLVAYLDPDKTQVSSLNNLLPINSLSFTNNSNQVLITKSNHNLNSSSTIRLKDSVSCSNFDDYEFNKRFDLVINDSNSFFISMIRKSTQNISCGDGNSFKYDVLTNNTQTCPISGSLDILNLRNYDTSSIATSCSSVGATLFSGTCGKSPGCSDPYRVNLSRPSPSDNIFRHINMNIPLTSDEGTFVSVEMWFKWNGDRSPVQVPPIASFNGTLVSFNNYNLSFMTVLNSSMVAIPSLCFNTQIASLDCYGMSNPDPIISNRWVHYVFVFNNGDVTKNKIYINGIERSVAKQGVSNPVSRYVSNDLKIGVNSNNSSDYFRVRGDLGITRVYDKELTSNVILNNYNEFKCLYQNICN